MSCVTFFTRVWPCLISTEWILHSGWNDSRPVCACQKNPERSDFLKSLKFVTYHILNETAIGSVLFPAQIVRVIATVRLASRKFLFRISDEALFECVSWRLMRMPWRSIGVDHDQFFNRYVFHVIIYIIFLLSQSTSHDLAVATALLNSMLSNLIIKMCFIDYPKGGTHSWMSFYANLRRVRSHGTTWLQLDVF